MKYIFLLDIMAQTFSTNYMKAREVRPSQTDGDFRRPTAVLQSWVPHSLCLLMSRKETNPIRLGAS